MPFWKIFSPKRRIDFYHLLEKQTETTRQCCEALIRFLEGKARAREVKMFETEADDQRRLLIDELNQTFLTPLDREDIFDLSRTIDDVADNAKNTMRELQVFDLESNRFLKNMAGFLHDGADYLYKAIGHLKKNPNVAIDYIIKAKRTENKMNREYLHALKELFSGDDVGSMMAYREVYRHLNRGADRVDEAANVLNNIIMKQS